VVVVAEVALQPRPLLVVQRNALIVMIGINLLGLRKVRTGDFLPSLVVIAGLVFLFDYIPFL